MSPLGDAIALPQSVETYAEAYRKAKPFPYVVIDDLFSSALLDRLVAEIPPVSADFWVHHDHEHEEKYGQRSAVELGPVGFQLTGLLHSANFLYFLSELTGIWQLLPDPYLQGGGYSLMPEGAKFDVHVDRNTAYETGLVRRVGLIIYLNKDWKPDYGGQLELWNSDGTHCEIAIDPLFNRTAIFEIGDRNYHGVPRAIAAPGARSRNSFLVYFHTACAGSEIIPHSSIYAPVRFQPKQPALRKVIKDLVPPFLFRRIKKLRISKAS